MWPFNNKDDRLTVRELLEEIVLEFRATNQHLQRIAMNSQEAAAALNAIETKLGEVSTSLTEASTEIPAELQKLRDLIAAGGTVTPEIEASIGRLSAIGESLATTGKGLADIVSNA